MHFLTEHRQFSNLSFWQQNPVQWSTILDVWGLSARKVKPGSTWKWCTSCTQLQLGFLGFLQLLALIYLLGFIYISAKCNWGRGWAQTTGGEILTKRAEDIGNGPVTNAATPSFTDVGTYCILLGELSQCHLTSLQIVNSLNSMGIPLISTKIRVGEIL